MINFFDGEEPAMDPVDEPAEEGAAPTEGGEAAMPAEDEAMPAA